MAGEPELFVGSEGEWVTHLQTSLQHRGFDPGAIDGHFGSRTEEALTAFQRSQGLTADGVAAAITWSSLHEGYGDGEGEAAADANGEPDGEGLYDLVAYSEAGAENIEIFDVEEFDELDDDAEEVLA